MLEKQKNSTKKNIVNDKLIITISKEGDEDELFKILSNDGKVPFKLPSHIMFPSGKKEFARRAKMLMLAGIDFLKEKYPQIELKQAIVAKEEQTQKNDSNVATF